MLDISEKNKISQHNGKSNISNSLLVILTAMYTVAYNSGWRAISLLWYGISLATIMVLLVVFIKRNRVRLDFYTGWAIIFLTFTFIH